MPVKRDTDARVLSPRLDAGVSTGTGSGAQAVGAGPSPRLIPSAAPHMIALSPLASPAFAPPSQYAAAHGVSQFEMIELVSGAMVCCGMCTSHVTRHTSHALCSWCASAAGAGHGRRNAAGAARRSPRSPAEHANPSSHLTPSSSHLWFAVALAVFEKRQELNTRLQVFSP